jgi:hypothetical protein
MCVCNLLYKYETKANGRKFLSFEKYSSAGRETPVFHHRLFCANAVFAGMFVHLMSAVLTYKMAALTKNDTF